jgi:hypothetical protein
LTALNPPAVSLQESSDPGQVPSLQHQRVDMKGNSQEGAPPCDASCAEGAVISSEAQCSKTPKDMGCLSISNLADKEIETSSVITELDVWIEPPKRTASEDEAQNTDTQQSINPSIPLELCDIRRWRVQ